MAETRVAVDLVHSDALQKEALKELGARGIVPIGNGVHVIFGPKAKAYAEALQEPPAQAA
jgi:PTS system D-glucosamine-specific IIC component